MRDYLSVPETSSIIASEVASNGSSKEWRGANPNTITLAIDLENHLSQFNIGLTDPRKGVWGKVNRGTRHYKMMTYISTAKSKLSGLVKSFKK